MKKFLIIYFFFVSFNIHAKVKAFWAPIWDISSKEKVTQVVDDAVEYGFNQIIAEVRYRGDALYFPNRDENSFHNRDVRSYVLKDEKFDPLQYLIDYSKDKNIQIIAWMTCFVITPHDLTLLPADHIYFKEPNWITFDKNGKEMETNILEGAFLDPGLPEVQDYLIDVIGDISTNYDIDGIHLDYVRYPGQKYGMHEKSLKNFSKSTEFFEKDSWNNWRENQINRFVARAYFEVKNINPEIEVSAAVFPKIKEATKYYSQNWYSWLEGNYIDKVYLMAYTPDNFYLKNILQSTEVMNYDKKIVVGLRGWSDDYEYPFAQIESKLSRLRNSDFAGFSFFSYGGLVENNYLAQFDEEMKVQDSIESIANTGNAVFGYIKSEDQGLSNTSVKLGEKVCTVDENGFFYFNDVEDKVSELCISQNEKIFYKKNIQFDKEIEKIELNNIDRISTNIVLSCENKVDYITLRWNEFYPEKLKIYRRVFSTEEIPFELIAIEDTDKRYFKDKNIDKNLLYEYKVSDYSESITKKILAIDKSKKIAFEIFQDKKKSNLNIKINLGNSARLNWRLISQTGDIVLKKQSWYKAGETTEKWNGVTEEGKIIPDGNYTLYCFSDTNQQEYKKEFEINFN